MLQTIVRDDNLHVMMSKNGFYRIGSYRRNSNRHAGTLEDQYRFIARFCRRGVRRQQQRVRLRFSAIAARNYAHTNAALLQVFNQPNNDWRFTIAASCKVSNYYNRHRCTPRV